MGHNGALVSRDFLETLMTLLDQEGLLEPGFDARLGSKLADHAELRQAEALKAKRARLERLRQEVADLEQELS